MYCISSVRFFLYKQKRTFREHSPEIIKLTLKDVYEINTDRLYIYIAKWKLKRNVSLSFCLIAVGWEPSRNVFQGFCKGFINTTKWKLSGNVPLCQGRVNIIKWEPECSPEVLQRKIVPIFIFLWNQTVVFPGVLNVAMLFYQTGNCGRNVTCL